MNKETIVVWFSCGAASAVAAKLTLDKYGKTHNVILANNPIKEEHPDNRRFLRDIERWLGVEIESVINPRYPDSSCVSVWHDRKYMSGVAGAPCTGILKKQARQFWEQGNPHDHIVLGFTLEELDRHERFVLSERSNVLPVLIDAKMTKQDCFNYIDAAGLVLPEIYKLGYPNANCIGCVKATSPTYWNHVRQVHPEIFEERAIQSRKIGTKLVRVKNKRLFLDELDPEVIGQKMKSLIMPDCGIFCEEK